MTILPWLREHLKGIVVTGFLTLLLGAVLIQADSRYLLRMEFQANEEKRYCREILKELREVRRDRAVLNARLKWLKTDAESVITLTRLEYANAEEAELIDELKVGCAMDPPPPAVEPWTEEEG